MKSLIFLSFMFLKYFVIVFSIKNSIPFIFSYEIFISNMWTKNRKRRKQKFDDAIGCTSKVLELNLNILKSRHSLCLFFCTFWPIDRKHVWTFEILSSWYATKDFLCFLLLFFLCFDENSLYRRLPMENYSIFERTKTEWSSFIFKHLQ